jgi:MbtH protein
MNPHPTTDRNRAGAPTALTEPRPETGYRVVVNDEEQYSLWPTDTPLPAGWHDTGVQGPRADCLAHIERVWTDLSPRSVREHLTSR